MSELHSILFNMHILYSVLLGAYASVLAAQQKGISGNYWGAMLTYSALAGITLLVGIVLYASGLRIERPNIYFLYMAFLVVIMPGLFSLLRGRDDRSAAIAFAVLAFFNASVSISMFQRGLVGPWQ
ncbi:MAG: hypothetical protein MUE40_02520 [Anaerolineae bacterium]|jgi:hypothetical protein|nr:hypothetical protein [Anaerolineae bacterium]